MKDILEYPSVKICIEGHSKATRPRTKLSIRDYTTFANSRESLTKEITPDDLIEEARKDVALAQKRLEKYYFWLQGEPIEGYRLRKKPIKSSSAS